MPTKKQEKLAADFNAGAREVAIQEYGAVPESTEPKAPLLESYAPLMVALNIQYLIMDTTYGRMTVWPATRAGSVLSFKQGKGQPKGSLYTVFCCFQDDQHIKTAGLALGSNPYSGKYNFHLSTNGAEDDLEQALRHFRAHLQRVVVL